MLQLQDKVKQQLKPVNHNSQVRVGVFALQASIRVALHPTRHLAGSPTGVERATHHATGQWALGGSVLNARRHGGERVGLSSSFGLLTL